MQERQPDFGLAEAVEARISQALIHCGGDRTEAAGRLGVLIRCLRDRLQCGPQGGIEITGLAAADDAAAAANPRATRPRATSPENLDGAH